MEYRAVGNRCAVSIDSLRLPVPREEVLYTLNRMGFVSVDVNIVALARQCVGTSCFRDHARLRDAPLVVDCSTFVKWLYAQLGMELPKFAIEQRRHGETVGPDGLAAGDLVFVSGVVDLYDDDEADGVGHVGIATGEGTVVNAANERVNVVETPLGKFIGRGEKSRLRGIRRYIPRGAELLTLQIPPHLEVERPSDIRWILMREFFKKQEG